MSVPEWWYLVLSAVLFSLGGLFSIYEGWHKLSDPEPLSYPWVAVGILVFGLVAEAVSMRACLHEVNKVRGERTIWQWFRSSRQSELVVILGEDFAALVKAFDHGDSSLRGGIGLGEKKGEIQPAIAENVVFSLKAGEVGPVIDMGFGFHVVKVIERDYAGLEPLDEKCQAKIKKMLGNQIAEREYKRIVSDLKRTATIVVYPN